MAPKSNSNGACGARGGGGAMAPRRAAILNENSGVVGGGGGGDGDGGGGGLGGAGEGGGGDGDGGGGAGGGGVGNGGHGSGGGENGSGKDTDDDAECSTYHPATMSNGRPASAKTKAKGTRGSSSAGSYWYADGAGAATAVGDLSDDCLRFSAGDFRQAS